MIIKARVSKNLSGSIMLPTVGPKALTANKEICFNEEQLYAVDIQGAISKKLIVLLNGPTQKSITFSKVTNLSFGSVSLPNVGVIRAGKTIDVRSNVLESPVYEKMVEDGLIAINIKFKTGKPQPADMECANVPKKRGKKVVEEEVDPNIPANMQKGRAITIQQSIAKDGLGQAKAVRAAAPKTVKAAAKKGTPDKVKKHGIRKVEDSLLIDPSSNEVEEEDDFLIDPRTGKKVAGDDGIIFVDHEQAAARMNPRLKGKAR